MRRLKRPPEPAVLAREAEAWTKAYVATGRFRWPTRERRELRVHLLVPLRAMTREHCSYCDHFPMDAGTVETIDHFMPKAKFRDAAFRWSNLYLACPQCQQRGDGWDDGLLRPDDASYDFEDWFVLEHDGTLKPNPARDSADQQRATVTINLFGLNERGHPRARIRSQRAFRALPPHERLERFWEYPYVFLLEVELDELQRLSLLGGG